MTILINILINILLLLKTLVKEYNILFLFKGMKGHKGNNKGKNNRERDPNEKISRTLSAILRHKAVEIGFQIDAAGYVSLNDIIAYLKGKGFKDVDEQIIQQVVDNNDKKRFEIKKKGHHSYIRATQGHSMKEVKTEELLQKIEDPTEYPTVIHGTYLKFWHLIKATGLKRMTRNHIHFAPGMPKQKDVISGMRGSCDIYIEIDMVKAMKDGIQFYISSNNVILTEGIDGTLEPKYFKQVRSKKGDFIAIDMEEKIQQKVEEKIGKKKSQQVMEKKEKKKQETNQDD